DFGQHDEIHVDGLLPREGYVFSLTLADGTRKDRTILSNRTNEEVIPEDRLLRRYFELERRLRTGANDEETHLVINTLTNPEELRLALRLIYVAYAALHPSYFCLSGTFLKCAQELVDKRLETGHDDEPFPDQRPKRRGYFRRRQLKWFETGQELVYRRVLPYTKYLILNRDELIELEPSVELKGLELVMRQVARDMNHGRKEFPVDGGRVLVSDGKRGARYAELLDREVGHHFWKEYGLDSGEEFQFAERVLSAGDDNVIQLTSTLGAGDTFAGVFIGLIALGWDVGHAIRAATLGAQYYIANRQEPMISDLIDTEDEHTMTGTFGNFRDMVTFHLPGGGVATPYGSVIDKVITIRTTQIHYPFWEVVARYAQP
ncbi:MAG: carbohydrate kinase family protein, partial [Proteobacteria bacterium]|nr:carbohydrate kinase family protein [Pseudomonadota bacterium]MBU1742173.1 carbohydrate kinase family protein [Pseudomonadota bacterium]